MRFSLYLQVICILRMRCGTARHNCECYERYIQLEAGAMTLSAAYPGEHTGAFSSSTRCMVLLPLQKILRRRSATIFW